MRKPIYSESESQEHSKTEKAIQEALRTSPYRSLRRLKCEFDGRILSLRGRVSTYYEKQIAQEVVLSRIGGHICFDNQLEVTANGKRNASVDHFDRASIVVNEPMALLR